MNARSLIMYLGAAAALYWPGCGPGLVPPSAANVANGGFAGARGGADSSTVDNPGAGTKTAGAGGSGTLPTTSGSAGGAGQAAQQPNKDVDAGSEDAGVEP